MGVLEKVRAEIIRHKMVQPGDLVVVGVSGGPDSVALLHVLYCLRDELGISLHVAHLNHMFRGEEAEEDASFVQDLAAKLGIPCTVEERDVPAYARKNHLSSEVAAREARYRFFRDVLQATGGSKLALAHHADDQAELVLMNILRGTGLKGLSGMWPVRDQVYIRPMLEVRRKDIEQYCHDHNLSFRIDSSNLKNIYLRNRIRQQLIPWLEKEYCPGLVPIISRMTKQIRDEEMFLESLAVQAYSQVVLSEHPAAVVLHRQKLLAQPTVMARRVLRVAWGRLRGNKQDLTFDHVENLISHLKGGGPERIFQLPDGIAARLAYETLTLTHIVGGNEPRASYFYELAVPGEVTIPETGWKIVSKVIDKKELAVAPRQLPSHVVALDYARVMQPLAVRNKRDGDVMVPFGLGQTVKLKKLFIDRKVPRHLRDRIPIVVEQPTGRVLWVAGIRMADEIGITPSTQKVMLLSLEIGNSNNT